MLLGEKIAYREKITHKARDRVHGPQHALLIDDVFDLDVRQIGDGPRLRASP